MPHNKLSDEELRKASNWLIYEIWMFRGLVEDIENQLSSGKGVVSNAILDAFLIRVRALLEFLYSEEFRYDKRNVYAEQYFSSSQEWKKIKPKYPEFLKDEDTRNRISQSIAHISHKRQKSHWDVMKIVEAINPAIDKFLEVVSMDLLGSKWEQFKREDRNLSLPPYRAGGEWGEGPISSFSGIVTPLIIETDVYPDISL